MSILSVLDYVGTFFFGLSGAMLAVRKKMDLLGVLVLASVTAFGGGVTRDVLLGNVPPFAFTNPVYIGLAVVAGLLVFFGPRFVESQLGVISVFDAVGLATFTVIGVRIGMRAMIPWWSAVLLGTVTGVVGGMLRDLLGGEIPLVLRREIYATASLAGGLAYFGLISAHLPAGASTALAAVLVVSIRLLAIRHGWSLPRRVDSVE